MIGEHRRAQHHDDVVALELCSERAPRRSQEAGEGRVVLGEAAPTRERTHPHGRARAFGERDHEIPRSVAVHAGADDQRWAHAVVQGRRNRTQPLGLADEAPAHLAPRDWARVGIPVVFGNRDEGRALWWLHRGVVGTGDRGGHIGCSGWFHAPLHIRLRQLGRLLGEEVGLPGEQLARLLTGRDDERGLVAHRREDAAERVSHPHCGVEVDEGSIPRRLREPIRHGDGG